jgi:hypothetical protein
MGGQAERAFGGIPVNLESFPGGGGGLPGQNRSQSLKDAKSLQSDPKRGVGDQITQFILDRYSLQFYYVLKST